MRRFILILIALVLSTTMASAETVYVLCNPSDCVNVREKPTTHSAVVGRMQCGYSFETDGVTKKTNGRTWVHMVDASLEVSEAWISSEFVSAEKVEYGRESAYVEAKGRVAVRVSPNGKRKGWLRPGDDVTVIAYGDEWALTTIGYVAMRYLTFYGGVAE